MDDLNKSCIESKCLGEVLERRGVWDLVETLFIVVMFPWLTSLSSWMTTVPSACFFYQIAFTFHNTISQDPWGNVFINNNFTFLLCCYVTTTSKKSLVTCTHKLAPQIISYYPSCVQHLSLYSNISPFGTQITSPPNLGNPPALILSYAYAPNLYQVSKCHAEFPWYGLIHSNPFQHILFQPYQVQPQELFVLVFPKHFCYWYDPHNRSSFETSSIEDITNHNSIDCNYLPLFITPQHLSLSSCLLCRSPSSVTWTSSLSFSFSFSFSLSLSLFHIPNSHLPPSSPLVHCNHFEPPNNDSLFPLQLSPHNNYLYYTYNFPLMISQKLTSFGTVTNSPLVITPHSHTSSAIYTSSNFSSLHPTDSGCLKHFIKLNALTVPTITSLIHINTQMFIHLHCTDQPPESVHYIHLKKFLICHCRYHCCNVDPVNIKLLHPFGPPLSSKCTTIIAQSTIQEPCSLASGTQHNLPENPALVGTQCVLSSILWLPLGP